MLNTRRDVLFNGKSSMRPHRLKAWTLTGEYNTEFFRYFTSRAGRKGWIQRTDNGQFAITVSGVDAVAENNLLLKKDRLLPMGDEFSRNAEASNDFNTDRTAFLTGHQREMSS
jgi:hypothetical protein